jgi:hypothetical protein
MDDLISTADAAKILGVTPRAVRWYHTNKLLIGREIADRLLFLRAEVETFVKPKKTGRPPKRPAAKKPVSDAKLKPKPTKKKNPKGA